MLPPLSEFSRVCVLTGAGISVAAGLGTFRGPGGSWTVAPDLEQAMHVRHLPENVDALWSFWGGMHDAAQAAGPTPAHRALAAADVTVITQNVDGLHHLAGSADTIEIHGSAGRARCLSCEWTGPDVLRTGDGRPRCPRCGALARPAVILFGEGLDPAMLQAARHAAATCDLFLAIGTSGRVAPASWLAPLARERGATVVNVDTDPGAEPGPAFHHTVVGDAQVLLTQWAGS